METNTATGAGLTLTYTLLKNGINNTALTETFDDPELTENFAADVEYADGDTLQWKQTETNPAVGATSIGLLGYIAPPAAGGATGFMTTNKGFWG
jgi:hypothetical protein